jgi:hypothetical protein
MNIRHEGVPPTFYRYNAGAVFVHEMLLAHFLRRAAFPPVAFRTQNPGVYMLAQALVPDAVHPRIGGRGGREAARAAVIARALMAQISPGKVFDDEALVVRAALGRYLYGPSSRVLRAADPAVAEYWRNHVAVENGDALVMVILPTAAEALRLGIRYWAAVLRDRVVPR